MFKFTKFAQNIFIVATIALLGACTSGDDSSNGGGILNNGGGTTTPDDGTPDTAFLTLTGPREVAPGKVATGYRATLVEEDGTAIEDIFVSIVAPSGFINAPPDQAGTNGANTSSFGRVNFSFQPPNNITRPTTITIKGSAEVGDIIAEAVLNVTVRPDVFSFTDPAPQAAIPVGSSNSQPLRFQWTNAQEAGGGGVDGTVTLTSDGAARFVINDDPRNARERITVSTDSFLGGDFNVPVAVFNNTAGFVNLTATDSAATQRKATLTVQFVDQPGTQAGTVNLDVSPLVVEPAPAAQRFAEMTFTVLNEAFEPVTGVDVVFSLVQRAGGGVNERVFPGGGTTNAQGIALSRYEAGTAEGTAQVRACVRDTNVCDTRDITVAVPPDPA